MARKVMRKIVNPLQLFIDQVVKGGKVPEELREHVYEVLRRVNIGAQFGFEWETYVLLASKMLAYVEWCKSMAALCTLDPNHEDYLTHTQNALRWQNAYKSTTVPVTNLEKLNRLRPQSKATAKRAQQTWAARHKDDPNAPMPGSPRSTIGRNEPSQALPDAPGVSPAWERPPDLEEESPDLESLAGELNDQKEES